MLHSSTETEGLIKGLVLQMVLNFMGIETFQKHPFWRQIFFSSSLYACGVFGSFDEKICRSWYGPQLNWNWKVYKGSSFFNCFELYVEWNFPEVAILVPKIRLYAWEVIGSFEDEIYTIGYAPRLNWHWKACNWTCFFFFFSDVLNYVWNRKISKVVDAVSKVCPTNIFINRNW